MAIDSRVAFIGEPMIELTRLANVEEQLGSSVAGDVLNSAIYFRRLRESDEACRLVTVLGTDPFSDDIAAFIQDEGIGTEGIRRHPTASCGIYAISTTADGERSFSYWRSASAARDLFAHEDDFSALDGCGILYLTGITLAIMAPPARERLRDWITQARGDGLRVAFDSNYRPALWEDTQTARHWIETFWRICDIGMPSSDDEAALFGESSVAATLDRFNSYSISAGALKVGPEGCYLLGGGEAINVPVQPVPKVVDTTAAGDSFNAGFLAAYLDGATVGEAAKAGHALARRVVQVQGAIMPV